MLIWGAGAMEGAIGAHLARAGHHVRFVDTAVAMIHEIEDGTRARSVEHLVEIRGSA